VLVVVLDSATPAVTAALAEVRGEGAVEILASRVTVDARAHGELLAPAIQAVLREADVKPARLTAVVAGVGPGPFTGLRVGLVTVGIDVEPAVVDERTRIGRIDVRDERVAVAAESDRRGAVGGRGTCWGRQARGDNRSRGGRSRRLHQSASAELPCGHLLPSSTQRE